MTEAHIVPIEQLGHRIAVLQRQITSEDEPIETTQQAIDVLLMCCNEVLHDVRSDDERDIMIISEAASSDGDQAP